MWARVQKVSYLVTALCVLGFLGSVLWHSFGGDYDKYGRVAVPGTATFTLPAGDVDVVFAFHTPTNSGGGSVVVPQLGFTLDSPAGVTDPTVKEDMGSSVSVNSAVRIRVWKLHVTDPGDYTVHTDGNVSAYIEPQLTFGTDSGLPDWPTILFAILFVVSLGLALVAGAHAGSMSSRRAKAKADKELAHAAARSGPPPYGSPTYSPVTTAPSTATPDQELERLAKVQQLTDLHSSGTLSDEEYAAAKARLGSS